MPTTFPASDLFFDTVQTQSASFTALPNSVNIVTTGAATLVCTLPPVASGGPVTVKKIDSAVGSVTVKTADGSLVDGVAGTTGRAGSTTQYSVQTYISDGSNWYQVW